MYSKLELLDVSYSAELDTSSNFCDEKSQNLPNISFDANLSIKFIDCKSDTVKHAPVEVTHRTPSVKDATGSQKSECSAERCKQIEQLNISYDSNDSIEFHDIGKVNAVHNPGITTI